MLELIAATLVSMPIHAAPHDEARANAQIYQQLEAQLASSANNQTSIQLIDRLRESADEKRELLQGMREALLANDNVRAVAHFEALKKWNTSQHPSQF